MTNRVHGIALLLMATNFYIAKLAIGIQSIGKPNMVDGMEDGIPNTAPVDILYQVLM